MNQSEFAHVSPLGQPQAVKHHPGTPFHEGEEGYHEHQPKIHSTPTDGNWYGPANQWYPHRVLYQIVHAIFKAGHGTFLGLVSIVLHPRRSWQNIRYAFGHPGKLIENVSDRCQSALKREGIVFVIVSAICMILLPGAGFFGKISDVDHLGEKARKASEHKEL